jgi:hypothetical protein
MKRVTILVRDVVLYSAAWIQVKDLTDYRVRAQALNISHNRDDFTKVYRFNENTFLKIQKLGKCDD